MGASRPTVSTQQEANRQAVLAFYEKGLNQKDAPTPPCNTSAALRAAQPHSAGRGRRAFASSSTSCARSFQSHSEIKRSFVDGDHVILHVHAVREPGTRGNAIVDIFRLENGKIVEHWDVIQPIPEKAANANTMFWARRRPSFPTFLASRYMADDHAPHRSRRPGLPLRNHPPRHHPRDHAQLPAWNKDDEDIARPHIGVFHTAGEMSPCN